MRALSTSFVVVFGLIGSLAAQTNTFPSTGSVGIGTATPATKLHVTVSSGASGLLIDSGAGDTWFPYIDNKNYIRGTTIIGDDGSNVGIGVSPGDTLSIGSVVPGADITFGFRTLTPGNNSSRTIYAQNSTSGAHTITVDQGQNGNDRAFILNVGAAANALYVNGSGRVGVGMTSPATALQVLGSITVGGPGDSTQGIDYLYGYYNAGKLFTLGSIRSSGSPFLGYAVKSDPAASGYLSSTSITIGRSAFEANNGYLAFLTGTPQTSTDGGSVSIFERMRIDANGNVGIGTINPTQKLAVNGTIRAKEVIVDTGWSDYVFDSNYTLAPLGDVERVIKRERHLPGIPSAEIIAERGVNMGEMQAKLLAKIEELTLHAIAQEKKIAALEAKVERLSR